jgi:hypothetical protein
MANPGQNKAAGPDTINNTIRRDLVAKMVAPANAGRPMTG